MGGLGTGRPGMMMEWTAGHMGNQPGPPLLFCSQLSGAASSEEICVFFTQFVQLVQGVEQITFFVQSRHKIYV